MKIAICIPCPGFVHGRFAQSLANMTVATMTPSITYNGAQTRPQIETLVADNGSIEIKRTLLALQALRGGFDYILWCDSDHVFPPDALLRLLSHDLPIVGCNYLKRTHILPTSVDPDGEYLWTTEEKAASGEVEPVHVLGFGLCLMKTPIFSVVPKPWFACEMMDDGTVVNGEDSYFLRAARSVGVKAYVDHRLSWEVGHIGERVIFNKEGENASNVRPPTRLHEPGRDRSG